MLDARETLLHEIKDRLVVYAARVRVEQGKLSDGAEEFYRGLLNLLLGCELKNMNHERDNFPAIDLGDDDARLCVQVSSTGTRTKVRHTLEEFFGNELHRRFDRLIVLVIGDAEKFDREPKIEDGFDFQTRRDIWDTGKLIREVGKLDQEKLEQLAAFLEKRMALPELLSMGQEEIGELLPGRVIAGKYRVLYQIGRGPFSEVFLAENIATKMRWAIKVISKAPENKVTYERFKQLLTREVKVLGKLKHVNIPGIVDVIEDSCVLLVVIEYVEGMNLHRHIEIYGAAREEWVIDWARQLCGVLAYLHSHDPMIVHNDVKPRNIMLKPNGEIVLIDFGVALEHTGEKDGDDIRFGTPGYASPEQYGGSTDQRSDIYSMGATLYHLITGRSPVEPPFGIHPIRQIDPQLSCGMEYIIGKCTKIDPEQRYQSVQELLADLEKIDKLSAKLKRKAFFRNLFRL